jgi:hypothetical protein
MSAGGKIGLIFLALFTVGGITTFIIIETRPAPTLASVTPTYSTTTTTTNSENGILTSIFKAIPLL